jgi:succinate dehydrogenase / fumarate reductase flavoprotein subunit
MVDLLIIGSGGAALTAALTAKAKGLSVVVVGKNHPTNSQTSMAQGGINAVFADIDSDSIESHISDTLRSSHGLSDEVMVSKMCQDAHSTIEWLESIGVPFSRDENSKVAQRRLGGASHKRACYSQDYTGLKILHTLYDNSLREGIEFLNEHYLLNLIVDSGVSKGATLLDISTGEVKQIDSRSLIIATGGYGSIYHGYTTNAFGSTGDGISAVVRAGGYISDIEFVQFHPTALKSSSILISESARGEGGYLLNTQGERFVDELLPRDVVARAIYQQLSSGSEVFLDIRHLGKEKLMELLPQEVHLCRVHEGVDPLTELIPIKPVAHYSMGGIDVDRSLEVRGIKGCFAVGECSNAKVHGANRLGGNSLLEIISFGKIVVDSVTKYIADSDIKPSDSRELDRDISLISNIFDFENKINFYDKREDIGKLFYQYVGIIRNENDLQKALSYIEKMREDLRLMGVGDKSLQYNINLVDFLEFINTLELSEMLLVGAINRQESRGAHYREDFPTLKDEYALHSIYHKEDDRVVVELERSYR